MAIAVVPIASNNAQGECDGQQKQCEDWMCHMTMRKKRVCRRALRNTPVDQGRLRAGCVRGGRLSCLDFDGRSGKRGKGCGWFDEPLEDGNVGTGGELDADFVAVGGIVVVLGEALADFAGCDADDWIGIGIVAGGAGEDLHTDGALLDLVGVALESLFDHEAEEGGITFALEEKWVREEQIELCEDDSLVLRRLRNPGLERGAGE